MRPFRPLCPAHPVLPVMAATLMACAALTFTRTAGAQRVYVYGPPPPAPPPPRYYYYDYREPPYTFVLGLDAEGAIPVNVPQFLDGNNLTGGAGFKLRAGEQIRLQGGLRFTPEVGYGYDHLWAQDDAGNAYDWDMHRVFAGARLSFGRVVAPVVYGHVGYGWQVVGDSQGGDGFAFDVGGAIDLRVIPHLNLGAHIEYAEIDAQPYAVEWIALGVHADLVFF